MMKIGLYNLEPAIVNTAMMQVSTYHKLNNDDVYLYSPLFHDEYDKIPSFVMPYDKFNRYQKDFSRWVNNKIEFKSCTWEEYQEKMWRNYGKS